VSEGKKKGMESFGRSFLHHFELGGGETICHHLAPLTCGLGRGTLESSGEAVPDYP
jgi:hypothetical protein